MVNIKVLSKVIQKRASKKPPTKPVPKPDYRISPVEKPKINRVPGDNRSDEDILRDKRTPQQIKDEIALVNKQQNDIAAERKLNAYLTNDTTYQQQIAASNKALGDYTANNLQSQNQYNAQYGQNVYNLGLQKKQSGIEQQGDFAGRGMYHSGGYAVADSERLNDYATRQTGLDMDKNSYFQNLTSDLSNFKSSQNLAQQQARQDAINRRALGLIGGGR